MTDMFAIIPIPILSVAILGGGFLLLFSFVGWITWTDPENKEDNGPGGDDSPDNKPEEPFDWTSSQCERTREYDPSPA